MGYGAFVCHQTKNGMIRTPMVIGATILASPHCADDALPPASVRGTSLKAIMVPKREIPMTSSCQKTTLTRVKPLNISNGDLETWRMPEFFALRFNSRRQTSNGKQAYQD